MNVAVLFEDMFSIMSMYFVRSFVFVNVSVMLCFLFMFLIFRATVSSSSWDLLSTSKTLSTSTTNSLFSVHSFLPPHKGALLYDLTEVKKWRTQTDTNWRPTKAFSACVFWLNVSNGNKNTHNKNNTFHASQLSINQNKNPPMMWHIWLRLSVITQQQSLKLVLVFTSYWLFFFFFYSWVEMDKSRGSEFWASYFFKWGGGTQMVPRFYISMQNQSIQQPY